MNTGQIFHLISLICYTLSAIAFAFTIYLFFRYKILDAFNVLSGRKLKQDMNRLAHLSGAASEDASGQISGETGKQKKPGRKKPKDLETEQLYGLEGDKKPGKPAGAGGSSSASDTDELYNTEATEELYNTEATDELVPSGGDSGTEELDLVVTGASDTDLL